MFEDKHMIINALMEQFSFNYDVAETIFTAYWIMGDLESLYLNLYENEMADTFDYS